MGECVLNVTSALGYCKCNPFFGGETCNEYECHKYCHNKASCYVLHENILEESKLKVLTVMLFFFENVIIKLMSKYLMWIFIFLLVSMFY